MPIYPDARIARDRPYGEHDHNTRWYFTSKNDYRVQFATSDPMEKVVAWYEKKLKVKCKSGKVASDGLDYREAVCSKAGSSGMVNRFRISEQPLAVQTEFTVGEVSSSEKLTGFELSAGKSL
jgi:hypothetical protein